MVQRTLQVSVPRIQSVVVIENKALSETVDVRKIPGYTVIKPQTLGLFPLLVNKEIRNHIGQFVRNGSAQLTVGRFVLMHIKTRVDGKFSGDQLQM